MALLDPEQMRHPVFHIGLPSGVVVPVPIEELRARIGDQVWDTAVAGIVRDVLQATVVPPTINPVPTVAEAMGFGD